MDMTPEHQTLLDAARQLRKMAEAIAMHDDAPESSHQHKLASLATEAHYQALCKEAETQYDPRPQVEHPFANYWLNRAGGAALGGIAGAALSRLPKGSTAAQGVIGGLAGAFVGEKAGEVKSLVDHARAMHALDVMGLHVPAAVRYPHVYGPEAHKAGVQEMKRPRLAAPPEVAPTEQP